MPARGRADLFAETAERKVLPEAIIEKDFWVCWMLKQVFSIEALSGDCSLRAAHRSRRYSTLLTVSPRI
jgi:hypothetical protein